MKDHADVASNDANAQTIELPPSRRIQSEISRHDWITKPLGWIVGSVVVVWGTYTWVKHVARESVRDPEFVASFARQIRPHFIFDTMGRVVGDYGVGERLDRIEIASTTNAHDLKVIMGFRQHIQTPPLVRPIDRGLEIVSVERGRMHDWVVTVRSSFKMVHVDTKFVTGEVSTIDTNQPHRFFVELIP